MPKKKVDPLIHCLNYFRDAPLEAARTALIIAADAIQHRLQTEHGVPQVQKKSVRKPASASAAASTSEEERTDVVSNQK
jgi:hypothetical protein